jgi:hypothetical protein
MPSFASGHVAAGGVLAASALLVVLSCGSDPSRPDNTSSGGTSGFQTSGTLPDPTFEPCVAKEADAVEGRRPVDIIFVIDNSESMGQEIDEVEQQINENFVKIIEESGADYRVVMLSAHGAHETVAPDGGIATQRICVKAPLSGTTCSPIPPKPVETPRFLHYNTTVGSTDAWCKVLTTFNGPADNNGSHPQGWAPFLRPSAFKIFAVITDDRVFATCHDFTFDDKTDDPISAANAAARFETELFSLSPQFGNAVRRNYVWHSIVGLAPFDPDDLSKPYPPDAPITKEKCTPDAVAPATGHQALSRLTGGLRYPTCGLDFTPIFKAMAADVIDKTVLACDYELPRVSGVTIDPRTAVVRYASSAGGVTDFEQVANEQACGPNKFYIEGEHIKLCSDSCLTVQNDPGAKVTILFGCLATTN